MIVSRLLTLAALALLACTAVRADDIKVNDPDVTVLTDSNFEAFTQQELALVEFYAPWCGHCKNLAPEYGEAATLLKGSGVVLGKLDATAHQKHGVSISGYPTLKIFRHGKMSDYNGPRQAAGIVSYMKKQVGPAAKPISNEQELQALQNQDPAVQYAIVAFFSAEGKQSQLQSSFNILSNRMRDEFAFGRSTDAALAASQGVPAGGEAIIAYLRGEKSVYTGSSKTAEVEAFIREHSLPQVGEYSEATAPIYAARNLPVAQLFIPVDRKSSGAPSKTMTYYTNRLRKVAERFAGKLLVSYADKVQGQKAAFESLAFEEGEVNTFAILDPKQGKWYKFDPEDYEDDVDATSATPAADSKAAKKAAAAKKKALDVEGWLAFCDDYLAGDVSAYVKSQRAPKDNLSRGVKIATANNFEELVEQDDKDVMIEFYAPWCGHCKALEPKYDELGAKLLSDASMADVVLAKLDATANEYPRAQWEVSGYPTIFFKPAGKTAIKYEGAREVQDMLDFIKKKGKTIKANAKKAKAAKKNKAGKRSKKRRAAEADD